MSGGGKCPVTADSALPVVGAALVADCSRAEQIRASGRAAERSPRSVV